jgi:hypothetical protein
MRVLETKKFSITLTIGKPVVPRGKRGFIELCPSEIWMLWFTFSGNQYKFLFRCKEDFKLPNFKKMRRDFAFWFKYYVLRSKVYFEASTTDCDCVTSEWDGICENIWAYKEMEQDIYESAEGATGVSIISKKEYRDYHHTTDHIMNAFENGRGRSINV